MRKKAILFICSVVLFSALFAQQPRYTFKKFVSVDDTTDFKRVYPVKTGVQKTFIPAHPDIWDIDDDSTTYMRGGAHTLLFFEGPLKNSKREGLFSIYVVDSTDHSKRYKIWEQTYSNDKLNGQWRTYTLHGTLVSFLTFKNDSMDGVSRNFWIDGKTIMDEKEYFNGRSKFIERDYYPNGKIKGETPYLNDSISGIAKRYYETGIMQEYAEFKNGSFDGVRKYFYPNGQVWIEQIYKAGKSWTVVANYTEKGQRRDAGSLRDGNGTIIFYDEDGTVRETRSYINGDEKKQ